MRNILDFPGQFSRRDMLALLRFVENPRDRYTLNPPDTIIKEGVPDPFGDLDAPSPGAVVPLDKKKATVVMRFDEKAPYRTLVG